jgi:hypothetical protein
MYILKTFTYLINLSSISYLRTKRLLFLIKEYTSIKKRLILTITSLKEEKAEKRE